MANGDSSAIVQLVIRYSINLTNSTDNMEYNRRFDQLFIDVKKAYDWWRKDILYSEICESEKQ